jgi:polar amino acid transport system permease protein
LTDLLGLISYGPAGWGDELVAGAILTLELALATLPFGLVIGFLVALAKNSRSGLLTFLGNAYTTVFRGLPELLTLLMVYYGGQIGLQRLIGLVAPGTTVEISAFVAGMIALCLVFSAFSSEVFLGALRAVARGQREAALALGLTPHQTLWLIVWPQLWRYALPGISNLWLILLKDTSLVSVIALSDLLRQTYIAVGATKQPFLFYSVACLIYLLFSIVSSIGLHAAEAWSSKGVRRASA